MKHPLLLAPVMALLLALFAVVPAAAQEKKEKISGEAVLAHPAGKLSLQLAELGYAGKIDEAAKLFAKSEALDWKEAKPEERKKLAAKMQAQSPEPKAFEAAIRKGGALTIGSSGAGLNVPMGTGMAVAFFELEGGKWRAVGVPKLVPGEGAPAKK